MENVVGDRVLIAVQAVNISRLSTHPVPTVPGTLIVVAGAGPKDSNGAGKSSFIAAITALLGDEQWRFASGAKTVAELLFNAELATGAGGRQWASADHGYIVGVFGDPARAAGAEPGAGPGEQPGEQPGEERDDEPGDGLEPITVWLRVNQEAPHLEIRWTSGVYLAAAPSEAERVARADEMWLTLPRSAGRRDVVARDLTKVLYGDRVRCVSFLSTSVRTKVATNLLSQPLNEISPERVFEAVAALTGLDAELDQEREARRDEHAKRVRAVQAAQRLREFEAESRTLLDTFDRRDAARVHLAEAMRCWRGRQARRLVAAADRDEALAAELSRHRVAAEQAAEAIAVVRAEIGTLKDDTLDRRLAEARRELAEAQARVAKLEADRAVAENSADELRGQIPGLEEARRFADGREVPAAERELAEAGQRLNAALKALGVADREVEGAAAALDDAEGGPAAAQLRALAEAGVAASGLLDAIDVAEHARDETGGGRAYEGLRNWPHEHAVIVDAAELEAAARALAGLPGSVLVSAAGVTVVGAFEGVPTGREARIKAAEQRLNRARDAQEEAARAVRRAEDGVAEARRRLDGAKAGVRLAEIERRLAERRTRLAELSDALAELVPRVSEAEREVAALDFRARTRDMEIERLEGRRARLEDERDQARAQEAKVTAERAALGLDALAAEWGGTVEGAREWLAALPEAEAPLTAEEWWRAAERRLEQALRGTFPSDGPSDGSSDGSSDGAESGSGEMPDELRFLLRERSEPGAGRTAREQATFPGVCGALASYLRGQEEYERHQRRQIEAQLATRQRDLAAADKGAEEAAQSTAVHRAALTAAIKARLTRVSEEFEKLDLAYGGYGATLEFPVPAAPSDPEQRWAWKVIPKWRRGEGQGYVPYNRRANTALMDEKAVKLVCAAAIASSGGGHLCLVLDELGRNLGKEHRREAVALFRRIGETYGITVIGALQDDMEPYAIDACGQYIKLRRSSDAMPYNEPPVIIGHDRHAPRVRALMDYVTRAPAATAGAP
ncbi:putative coiled-coil protein SlyX [Thermocatellispora tengchongensis]|uniref:Putative coiled-coil protein SlyX n=1 Tax=Thermocatellispora tengchongensis TaxID=1073253 RepID=A0A840NY90_9ACTN|nr:chromosome partitioning protein ParA [Thermocatellispora tengchongensis]MBB5131176.1 putative coiled-coil protein SlyX [Thermocatellispora tengchongensis]